MSEHPAPAIDRLIDRMHVPPLDLAPFAFWFWNDDLQDTELLRQLHEFAAAGFGGVTISARIGLSRRIGYLTDEYFRLLRMVVDECSRIGLQVMLYDEASYPSGSAAGLVVAADPELAARALLCVAEDVMGEGRRFWRPDAGRSLMNRLVGVSVARLNGGVVDHATLQRAPADEWGVVRLDLEPGEWRLMACFNVPSGGHIRGVHAEQEDRTALAPAAADLLNPVAVQTFLQLTHDAYARALGDHFGSTVVAMFTDEPCLLGRDPVPDVHPFTPGLVPELADRLGRSVADTASWLPALWHDFGPGTAEFRGAYVDSVQDRLSRVYYAAQTQWCADHGVLLTGHPSAANDMSNLESFGWPGQDVVWRWVLPGDGSALNGPESVSAKAAASALQAGAPGRRALTEVLGAYGWQLSLDEVKWLLDWHLVRGVDLFVLHAMFYSLRGGRAFESEPDVGLHNPWWPHLPVLISYLTRMSLLLNRLTPHTPVAVLGNGSALPWQAATELYRGQIDFFYLDEKSLTNGQVRDGRLQIGGQRYSVVVEDDSAGDVRLGAGARAVLDQFSAAGGHLLSGANGHLATMVRQRLTEAGRLNVRPAHPVPELRVSRLAGDGLTAYLFVNEGEQRICTDLDLQTPDGSAEWWDPLTGDRWPALSEATDLAGSRRFRLQLQRRASLVLLASDDPAPPSPLKQQFAQRDAAAIDLTAVLWTVTGTDGKRCPGLTLGDWTDRREWERFAGSLLYRTTFRVHDRAFSGAAKCILRLGQVGELAKVRINGVTVGQALWAPYEVSVDRSVLRPGENELTVLVTNNAANRYQGALRPSGLIGPVTLALE